MKLGHKVTPHTGINSKWIKDLNISHETIKILEENIGRKISDNSNSNIFADISPRARETKENINELDYKKACVQNKKVLHSKGNHKQNEKGTH